MGSITMPVGYYPAGTIIYCQFLH